MSSKQNRNGRIQENARSNFYVGSDLCGANDADVQTAIFPGLSKECVLQEVMDGGGSCEISLVWKVTLKTVKKRSTQILKELRRGQKAKFFKRIFLGYKDLPPKNSKHSASFCRLVNLSSNCADGMPVTLLFMALDLQCDDDEKDIESDEAEEVGEANDENDQRGGAPCANGGEVVSVVSKEIIQKRPSREGSSDKAQDGGGDMQVQMLKMAYGMTKQTTMMYGALEKQNQLLEQFLANSTRQTVLLSEIATGRVTTVGGDVENGGAKAPSKKSIDMGKPKEKTQMMYPRRVWLITYASGSPDITRELLGKHNLACVECYTITWRESKYTLIRLTRAQRLKGTRLRRLISKIEQTHGIKGQYIMGYDMLSSNSTKAALSVEDHPGFRRMVQLINEDPTQVRVSMETGDIASNKIGLLYSYLIRPDPAMMPKPQLIREMKEMKADNAALKSENTALKSENEELRLRLGCTSSGEFDGFHAMKKKDGPSTHAILRGYRRAGSARKTMKAVMKLERKLNRRDERAGRTEGSIYAATNIAYPHLFKLGYTCRDAETRVRELQTAGVLDAFELVRHARVDNAR